MRSDFDAQTSDSSVVLHHSPVTLPSPKVTELPRKGNLTVRPGNAATWRYEIRGGDGVFLCEGIVNQFISKSPGPADSTAHET